MARTLIIVLFVLLLIGSAISFSLQEGIGIRVAFEPSTPSTPTENTEAVPETFTTTGTLIFYPNNVGPVPYIFYQDQNGRTAAKALTFPNGGSPAGFSSWTGARISVTGILNNEHLIVSRITYLSGP